MNNRLYILLLFFVLCGIKCLAQNKCVVSGNITDANNNEPIQGVNVSCVVEGELYGSVSDKNGYYSFSLPICSNTTLKFSHMSYNKTSKIINGYKRSVNVNVKLTSAHISLDEIEIKHNIPLIAQRSDTTVYFADAYKVNSDASAYDLISQKLPGIGLKDGKLEAHGEEVKEIRIDGREFFKNDVNLALKNLPANVINEIQIYDQVSDYSMVTGFDDGVRKKVINIKTKREVSRSRFGKGYLGGGMYDTYKLYGMHNLFKDETRWSLFAQCNNINEQNFSIIDLLSVTGTASTSAPTQSPYSKGNSDGSFHPAASDDISSMLVDVSEYGITKSMAVGSNYSDEWLNGNMKFSGHYLFNNSDNSTDYNIFDRYFGDTSSDNLQYQRVGSDNTNHRFNAKYEYKISPSDYLLLRPNISYQKKNELSDLIDYTVTSEDTTLLLNQETGTEQYVVSTSGEAMYIHRFTVKGHALAANIRLSQVHTHEDISMDFSNHQTFDKALQSAMAKNTQNSLAFVMSYIHSLTKKSRFKLDVGWNDNTGLARRKTEIMRDGSSVYLVDSLLSGSTWNNYSGFLVNFSYMFNSLGNSLVVGTECHSYNLCTSNDAFYFKRNYRTWLPYILLRYRIGRSQFHLQYRTTHKYPGLLQLHDAINNSNAIMAVRGNIKLEPGYHNNLTLRWISPVADNGSVFVFFTNLEQADNYISSMRSLASESFAESGERRNTEIRSYTNSDGYFSCSSLLAYGFPVGFISSNLNLSLMGKFVRTPGYWDDIKVFTELSNLSGSFTIGSNISENVDFVLDINGKYTKSKNVKYEDINVEYYTLSYGGQLNWQLLPPLKVVLECGQTKYYGSGVSNFDATISNASIAYKFLKKRSGELRLSVNDILNQNNSFYQATTEIYRREVTTNTLGRYVMLTFTYNLNTIKH